MGPFQKAYLLVAGLSWAANKSLPAIRSSTGNKQPSHRHLAVFHSRLQRVFCHPDVDAAEYGCNKTGTPPAAAAVH